jgi:hypothetical protein
LETGARRSALPARLHGLAMQSLGASTDMQDSRFYLEPVVKLVAANKNL